MHLPLCVRVAVAAMLVAVVTAQQCDYDVKDGYVIDVHSSDDNTTVFMSDVNASSQEECENRCCQLAEEALDDGRRARCNLAVFHSGGKPNKNNCFLVYCSMDYSCRLSKLTNFTSSFITSMVVMETTVETDDEETTELSTLLADDYSSLPTEETTTTTTANNSETSKPTEKLEPAVPVKMTNDTAASVDDGDDDKEQTSKEFISSNGALIAASCFGILFLLAILVVLGKHWYEGYQRRHYSKVDYLINGMYNN